METTRGDHAWGHYEPKRGDQATRQTVELHVGTKPAPHERHDETRHTMPLRVRPTLTVPAVARNADCAPSSTQERNGP